MNFFQIISLATRFYALKSQFEQIRRGDFQLPPLVVTFLKDADDLIKDSGEVIKELGKAGK
jgi:hypothetical protein